MSGSLHVNTHTRTQSIPSMGRMKKSTAVFNGWGSEVNRGKHTMIMLKIHEHFK